MSPDDVAHVRRTVEGPLALLMTQPRYGMGYLRSREYFAAVRSALNEGDVLIIDEAADQTVPSVLGQVDRDGPVQIVRIRGITKGLGLNSARIAAIFHPRDWREGFAEIVDYAGGTLDTASLRVATTLCAIPERYGSLLSAARQYVRRQHDTLAAHLRGLPISLSPIDSGYVGSAHVLLPGDGDFASRRSAFLNACREERMPVVLGSSMYFPYDFAAEIFRVNYFTPEDNMIQSASCIGRVLKRFNAHKLG